MLIITELPNDKISIKANYYYSKRIRQSVPNAVFDYDEKRYIINKQSLKNIERDFEGELYYKTPKWVLHNEPAPDYSQNYKLSQEYTIPELKYEPYDYQKYGIQFMIDKINQNGFVLNSDDVGLGKCHGKGTKILMANGTIKNVEDIKVGEQLMGDDGTPRNVLSLAHGQEQMYKITLENGDFFTCNESHIVSLQVSAGNKYKQYRGGDIVNISIKDYLQLTKWVKEKVLKAYKKPIDDFGWDTHGFDIEPYMYGLWLGDGNSRHFDLTINNDDIEIIQYIKDYAIKNNLQIHEKIEKAGCTTYCLNKGSDNSLPYKESNMIHVSALNGKHIYPAYKYSDRNTRLQVLAGLLDADGSLMDNVYEISTKFEQLKEDILFIARSLGFSVSWKSKTINDKAYYRIFISGDTDLIPILLPRKKATQKKQKENPLLYSFAVEPLGIGDYYGFSLDGNHLYLLGDFTVTHNTIQTIGTMKWFIEHQNVKKILIVCKKTIKTQWAEEIDKFTDLSDTFKVRWTEKTKKHRLKVYEEIEGTEKAIMITNYHSFLNDKELIKSLNFDLVVIDEIHSVKARNGVLNNNIAYVCKEKKSIFLTGTPIMSKPEDIYGIVQIAKPDYFGNWNSFATKFLTVDEYTPYGPQIVGAKNMDELRKLIQDIIIRRTEYEVSIDLPQTITENQICKMDKTQIKMMEEISVMNDDLVSKLEELIDPITKKPDADKIEAYDKIQATLKGLISLRQGVSSDPRIFMRSRSKMTQRFLDFIPSSYKMSNKTETLLDLVEDIVESDNKVIIFTKYRMSAELLRDDIEKNLKYKVLLYTGEQDSEERDKNVHLFKTSFIHNVLIGTEAMAEGLNLQVAKYLINYDLPDTAAIYIQRIGRCRRASSSHSNIICYNLMTENSKDIEKMNNILQNMDLTGALVDINEAQREALLKAIENV